MGPQLHSDSASGVQSAAPPIAARPADATLAVVFEAPGRLSLRRLALEPPGEDDVVVDLSWSGISTGTERLLWSGRMPAFPGLGYPLVPGYESVGRVVDAGSRSLARIGETVFVPGARCFGDVRGLFGGAAARLVVPAARALRVDDALGADAVLLALAATAEHALAAADAVPPDLVVGHGVLGRLLARVAIARGHEPPVVWERDPGRCSGALGYRVLDPDSDRCRSYRSIYDVSGDASLLDTLIGRLAPGGSLVLAGFYGEPLSFAFPPAFLRELRIRVAAEWKEPDLVAVNQRVASGRLSLGGLVTHRRPASDAAGAYETAFTDASCLKMILDWRACS